MQTNHKIGQKRICKINPWNEFDLLLKNKKEQEQEWEKGDGREPDFCNQCGCKLYMSEDCSSLICNNAECACVLVASVLDHSPEWRNFAEDLPTSGSSDISRCGMPTNLLLTESSFSCRIARGGRCSKSFRSIMRYTEWMATPNREKVLMLDFRRITSCAENCNLSKKLIDDAHYYYKLITEDSKKFRGIRREAMLAAAVYISCKMNGSVRTALEISQMFYIDLKNAMLGCKNAHEVMFESNLLKTDSYIAKTTPDMLIERFVAPFQFSKELINMCLFVAKKVERMGVLSRSSPSSVTAGILYFIGHVCNLPHVTKHNVHLVCDMSEVTINSCFRKLNSIREQLIPPSILAKYSTSCEKPKRKKTSEKEMTCEKKMKMKKKQQQQQEQDQEQEQEQELLVSNYIVEQTNQTCPNEE